jgi:hypothetical protein
MISWKVWIISIMLEVLMDARGSAFKTSIRIQRPNGRYMLTDVPVIPKMICNTMTEPLVLVHARHSPRQSAPDSILGLSPWLTGRLSRGTMRPSGSTNGE